MPDYFEMAKEGTLPEKVDRWPLDDPWKGLTVATNERGGLPDPKGFTDNGGRALGDVAEG